MTKTKTGPTERKQVAKDATVRKGSSTRDAIVKLALRMIAEKGVAGTSVLEITQTLGISNGTFYYHFVNMEQLLEDVGLRVVASLIEESKQVRRPDPAAQVARLSLIADRFVQRNPELEPVMLRVVEDPEGRHADLADNLREEIIRGRKLARFAAEDIDLAVQFCKAISCSVWRSRDLTQVSGRRSVLTAVHGLAMLGVPLWEAHDIVARELQQLESEGS